MQWVRSICHLKGLPFEGATIFLFSQYYPDACVTSDPTMVLPRDNFCGLIDCLTLSKVDDYMHRDPSFVLLEKTIYDRD